MPHNNVVPAQESAYFAENAHLMRPQAMTADPYNGMMLPHGPPVIHRGAPGTGGGMVMVYVPTTAPTAHHQHHPHAVHMVPTTGHYEAAPATGFYTVPAAEHQQYQQTTSDESNRKRRRSTAAAASFDSQHEAAHSVLLLAKANQEQQQQDATTRPDAASPTLPAETVSSHEQSPPAQQQQQAPRESSPQVPFKKRKMVSEIIRSKNNEEGNFHVSPVSHGSKTAQQTPACSPDRSHASHNSSYEHIKGGEALPDSAKVGQEIMTSSSNTAASPTPPCTVTLPHFPSQLYNLLEKSAEGVVQWCAHGRAWRIVRWDALRKTILPQLFGGGASVDSFLAELSAWGFHEVNQGTDVGAYSHTLFRRGFFNLCKEIRRMENEDDHHRSESPSSTHSNGDRSNGGAPSILQVPSLGDAAARESDANAPASPVPTAESTAANSPKQAPSNTSSPTSSSGRSIWPLHPQPPVYIPYRQEVAANLNSTPPQQAQSIVWTSAVVAESMTPAYSPVGIRSGRGAARARRGGVPAQVTPNPHRSVFPVVSNRGRRTSTSSGMIRSPASSVTHSPTSSHHHMAAPSMPTSPSTATSSPLRSALKPAASPDRGTSPLVAEAVTSV
mmetsp:Transcript_15988/g.33046  ORF Transcript_15988/g.33046 Transcript_15988/m.33046 type:complete len:613 (-) Transcript_15988:145-1983(-)